MKLVSHMLPYLLLVLAFAIPVQAQGTGEITGTVLGFQSEPLASAAIRIEIDGEQREFPTAEDGTYSATLPRDLHRDAVGPAAGDHHCRGHDSSQPGGPGKFRSQFLRR